MAKTYNRALKIGGEFLTINSIAIRVLTYDHAGNVLKASGATVPTLASAGYAVGCEFIQTDGGAGTVVYKNVGSISSCDFRADSLPETATGTYTLKSYGSTSIDSSAAAVTGTLGSGEYIGQIKTIVMTEASNSSTVSITNHQTSDPEVATFDAVDETGVFMWTGTEWVTIFATCTFV